jgi:hypothetical protein
MMNLEVFLGMDILEGAFHERLLDYTFSRPGGLS